MGQPISSEWLAVLGSCLRGSKVKLGEQQEISFLDQELQDRFHQEQIVRFLAFWQVIVPVALGILFIVVVGANLFLDGMRKSIESESGFALLPSQSATITQFEASSTAFNNEVAMIHAVESTQDYSYPIINEISLAASTSGVTISRLSFSSLANPLTLSGLAPSEAEVLSFKAALEGNPKISQINLPLVNIQPAGTNFSFSLSFFYKE
jgi:Tfp pilus assembly protein PilN